jgi:hypothetical protein
MANEKHPSSRQVATLVCAVLLAAILLSRFGLGLAGAWLQHLWAFQVLGAPLLHILAGRLHADQMEQLIRLWRAGVIFTQGGAHIVPQTTGALAIRFTSFPAKLRRPNGMAATGDPS